MGSIFAKVFPRDDTLLLGERIGRGSYGEVYRGTLGRNRRPVAVKKIYDILLIAARENRQSLQRLVGEFRLECELLQVAKHPNVVEFIGVFYQGEGEESALLVMELMEQTLEHFLEDNRGTLPQEKQVSICLQIASGLLFLHQHDPQILHRDLTAKNVLMNKEGSIAKISDFGQAKYRPTSVINISPPNNRAPFPTCLQSAWWTDPILHIKVICFPLACLCFMSRPRSHRRLDL